MYTANTSAEEMIPYLPADAVQLWTGLVSRSHLGNHYGLRLCILTQDTGLYWIQDSTGFTMFSFDGAGQCKDQSVCLVVWETLEGGVRVTRSLFPPDSWRQNGCVSTPVIWLRAERRSGEGTVWRSFYCRRTKLWLEVTGNLPLSHFACVCVSV